MQNYFRNLNKIEFAVTMACTGKCRHCQNGDQSAAAGHIDAAIAVRSVREICQNYNITCLMTFGGEPLLFPDVVFAIHRAGTELGVEKRQVITNGFFSKDEDRIEKVVKGLYESGVNDLLLSADAFHQEIIPLEPVLYFAECAVREGVPIRLNPAWLVGREDDNPYNIRTREILRRFGPLGVPQAPGNVVFPCGNALKYLGDYFDMDALPSSPYDEDPTDVRTISFSADGGVLNDNVYRKGIIEIIRDYRP